MNTLIFSLAAHCSLADALSSQLHAERGLSEVRDFPDGEVYVRIHSNVQHKKVILVCSLDQPNPKVLPLMFMAQTLKSLGAEKIFLVSPYLPYMRQDKQFKPGEAISAVLFAKFLSGFTDALITVDPHLHRIKNLSEIYPVPTIALHATKSIAAWIQKNVPSPLLIGPDQESAQWVVDVAKNAQAPYVIIRKSRHGDRNVSISVPPIEDSQRTPIIVDDIISTGASMAAVIQALNERKLPPPICITIHPLFHQEAFDLLKQAGAQQIISCNTVGHFSNTIDLTDTLIEAIRRLAK